MKPGNNYFVAAGNFFYMGKAEKVTPTTLTLEAGSYIVYETGKEADSFSKTIAGRRAPHWAEKLPSSVTFGGAFVVFEMDKIVTPK